MEQEQLLVTTSDISKNSNWLYTTIVLLLPRSLATKFSTAPFLLAPPTNPPWNDAAVRRQSKSDRDPHMPLAAECKSTGDLVIGCAMGWSRWARPSCRRRRRRRRASPRRRRQLCSTASCRRRRRRHARGRERWPPSGGPRALARRRRGRWPGARRAQRGTRRRGAPTVASSWRTRAERGRGGRV